MEDTLRTKLYDVLKDKRYLEVLEHLKKANIDYGKSIMLNTKIPIDQVVDILDKLEQLGLMGQH